MKVSVLIPAYNAEKYIAQCLGSVCNQTYRDLQIVVIDDGSKDSTLAVILSWAEKDNRIEVISRENKGVSQTRNELIDCAKGDFVLFVDADDWIEHDMISTLVVLSEKNGVDLVMCRNVNNDIEPDKGSCKVNVWERPLILNKFLQHRELTGALWNKLIRKELFDGIRFKPEISYGEDAMVIWDILNKIDKMASTTQQFYHYRMNATSISHQSLSESKMSVIPVWEYISGSKFAIRNNLVQKAKARYGAEITLLLYETVGTEKKDAVAYRVKILRNKLKYLYPYMLRNGDLLYKLKLFAGVALFNWKLLNIIAKSIK